MAMPRIEGYRFGCMTIDGHEYRSDLIIYPDGRIEDSWWRGTGHRLVPSDIERILDSCPQIVVIGTGASGLMKVTRRVTDECERRRIDVAAHRTADAAARYNESAQAGDNVAACFHLTC